ncbi:MULTISPECIES: LLM class flavin-dependent oxidoreductase [unclassified Parafrankia]|uniref:LLM class flavin-dependent oxidoreductase n=1 Tax=unclassified Parafrankia TaxID=2994368 RepID=UPI000DA558B0|nr:MULTISPECIES: LLM class flavin-dependent oxidoreductase [unclassified Parafrankia]TCJ37945.1 LLM class flavin-dependent oxidoreductase [Parafrankia sp. BMG5.11]SQD97104.1 Luciferase family protein [Parafrankia sp. Ea1.12]
MLFALRFDFRNPDLAGTTMADRYAAALDMAEWADQLGCVTIAVSEHHGSPDGYLPSPIPMLAAMAARTTKVRFRIAALIAPFHDPLRLAEDLIFLDNISKGRVDLIVAGGYVREEFAMFDIPMSERGRRVTETVTTLKAAFSGEPFEYRGRTVHLTPGPFRPGGPQISLGGSSEPAARRAARIADGFVPSVPEVWEFYRDEVQKLGRPDPGPSPIGPNQVTALAEDADEGWKRMSPFFLHETNAYGVWQAQNNAASPYRTAVDADHLRTTGQYRVLTPEQLVAEQKAASFAFTQLHPLCGGMPPESAWDSLRLFEREVLPAFR